MDLKTGSTRPGVTAETEIELKLRTDPDGMAVLLGSPRLGQAARDGKYRHMNAVYYDTPDFRLLDSGMTFRIREEDGRFVQTVKSSSDRGGAMTREERKVDVPTLMPRPDWLSGAGGVEALEGIAAEDLKALFTTKFDRLSALITIVGENDTTSVIEMACDRGQILSDKGETEISELELELKSGDPAALFDLALELHGHYPVQVETASKASRGYDLVTGRWPAWYKLEKSPLARDISIDEAMEQVFRGRYGDWLANERAAVDGRDPEGVHQVRVALRRLRSALVVFGTFIPPDQLAWLKSESRWVASTLGPARDLDVFETEILEPVMQTREADRGLLALRQRTEEARAAAYEEVRGAIGSPRYGRFVLDLGRWLEVRGWRHDEKGRTPEGLSDLLRPWSAKVLNRQYRKVMKLGRKLKSGTDEQRHELRIAIKKLRYVMEFVPEGYPEKKVKAFRLDLTRLQDGLGHMNDVALTEARLDHLLAESRRGAPQMELARACGQVLGWCARSALDSQAEIWDIWDGLQKRTPFWCDDA